jgi:pimeloyl-ACP methyl ester carboxylesterase
MATIVIVHGAGTGGWLWQGVRRRLTAAGQDVYTPTLTGLGERVHLASPAIGLTTHINDILSMLYWEDLRDVTLVGHSYGGMIVAAVADQMAERLAQVVYIDAFVPRDGQSMWSFIPPQIQALWEQQAQTMGEGWRLPPLPAGALGQIEAGGLTEDAIRALLDRRLDQPLRTYQEPVRLTRPAATSVPHSYIYCADKPAGAPDPFGQIAAAARQSPHWRCYDLPSGHFPMLTMPRALTELLLQLT